MNIGIIGLSHLFQLESLRGMKQIDSNIKFVYSPDIIYKHFHGDVEVAKRIFDDLFEDDAIIDKLSKCNYMSNANQMITEEWCIDTKMLIDFKETESYFMRMTDRNAAFHLSVHNRRQYFIILLNHFANICRNTKIDYFIAFDTPHYPVGYLLSKVAEYFGIKLILLEHHFLQDHSLVLDGELPTYSDSYKKDTTSEELLSQLPLKTKEAVNQYNDLISKCNQKEKKALIGSRKFSGVKLLARFIKKGSMNVGMALIPSSQKNSTPHFVTLNEIKSPFIYKMRINSVLAKLLRLNHYYNKVSVVPDLKQKYIFFGMHMQPEKTSLPMAGEFDNHLLPIKILSDSLPKGWFLYVKEHPNQFRERGMANNNFRSKEFYDAIRKIKNVKLVSLNVSSSELLDNSRIASTLTGTLGWEALLKNKPVIAFGQAYYKACKAVVSPNSVKECTEGISMLDTLTEADVKLELLKYLSYYTENGHLIETERREREFERLGEKRAKHIENLSKAILNKIA